MKIQISKKFQVKLFICFALSFFALSSYAGDVLTKNDVTTDGFANLSSIDQSSSATFSFMRGSANRNNRLRSGVTFKIGTFNPGKNYGVSSGSLYDNFFKTGFNFQIGTHIYIGPAIADMVRFGLNFTWIEFSYAKYDLSYLENSGTYNFGFIGLGPIVTFSPHHNIAVDAYFKAVPTYSLNVIDYASDDNNYNQGGFAFTNLLGVGFRFKVLYVGFESNWGKVDYVYLGDDSNIQNDGKLPINNTRLFFGVKL